MAPAYWLAPEVALGNTSLVDPLTNPNVFYQYRAADIWSFGCTVVEMATGYPPFYDSRRPNRSELEVLIEIVTAFEPRYDIPSETSSPELKEMLTKVFDRNVKTRPTTEDLKSLSYFRHTM